MKRLTSYIKTSTAAQEKKPSFSLALIWILAAGLLLSLSACDDSFDPFSDEQTDFFAIHGFLDMGADTQFVRVSPLRNNFDGGEDINSIPRVTSTLLETGEIVVWRDSLVRLDTGGTGLLYYTPMKVEAGQSYRLVVQRDDDKTTEALTQIPPPPPFETGIVWEGVSGYVQNISWLGMRRRPEKMNISYRVSHPSFSVPDTVFRYTFFDFGEGSNEGMDFKVTLSIDRRTILNDMGRTEDDKNLILHGISIDMQRRSEEWDVPDIPVNIQDGFGFFGAIAHFSYEWTLDAATITEIGFAAPQ